MRELLSFIRFLLDQTLDTLKKPDLIVKYIKAWWKAFRPLSLVIAAASCLLGVILAFRDGYHDYTRAILVVLAGSILQGGVNLINDFFEFKQNRIEDKIPHLKIFGGERNFIEWVIFLSGLACFAVIVPIGLYLVYLTGWPLLVLGIVGFIGGYFYTGEPFNYKRKGLGIFLVFFLMGVFMIAGSYYAVAGTISLNMILVSLPLSALVSNILLANELRDFENDTRFDLKTLTVRIGYIPAWVIFITLYLFAYGFAFVLYFMKLIPPVFLILAALPLAVFTVVKTRPAGKKRKTIIPWMMIHHLLYGAAFVIVLLVFTSCSGSLKKYQYEDFAMHTIYQTIIYTDQGENKALELSKGAFKIVHDLDSNYNALLPGSQIYSLNSNGSAVLNEEGVRIFKDALTYCSNSDGAFDITVYPIMQLWGFYVSPLEPDSEPPHHLATKAEIDKIMPFVGYKKVKLEGNRVVLPKGVKVDLGGVLKGYAVDRMAEYLIKNGVKAGLVNAGGNLRVFGDKPGGPEWTIGIRHPRQESDFYQVIKLKKGTSIATSGDYEQYFITNNIRYYHIFNPKTGFNEFNHVVSVSVVVPSAEDTDAFTKPLFLMGPDKGIADADRRKLAVLFIMETNGVLYSTNSADWNRMTE